MFRPYKGWYIITKITQDFQISVPPSQGRVLEFLIYFEDSFFIFVKNLSCRKIQHIKYKKIGGETMFVIHLEHAPDSIRGELSLFSQEIAPFTFVSNASARTRDRLWEDITNIDGISAVLVYTNKNEQKYSVKKIGYPSYEFEDFDGLQMIVKPENTLTKMIAEKLWAKLNPKKSLIDHMLETGIVAGCLMNGIFKPLISRLVELTGIDETVLKQQIVFICAMHDIGKAHPVFQGRDNETNEMLRGYELNQETASTVFRHEEYADEMIKKTDLFILDADVRSKMMIRQIISLHHQKEKERKKEKDFVEIKSRTAERWGNIQKYIYNYIKEIFPCEKIEFPDAVFKNPKTEFVVKNGILGILITSDWIASNNKGMNNKTIRDFSDINEYLKEKEEIVKLFLFSQDLTRSSFPNIHSFDSIFHFGDGRPVQRDVVNIVQKNNIKLMLIESGCGSGKTEAALYAASVLGNKKGLSGIYMGLPTGTSAEAIQDRVDDFLNELHMGKTKLYTSKSMLLRENNTEPLWTDVSRQRLLTPSAVGTVDQVMTAARLVRFESVRMAGLSSKVLIIDEIHAYDAYMITVIERLLQICNVLEIPVILLSATLPISTKKKLFSTIVDESDIDVHSGYPLISYVTTDNEFYECQSESHEPDKNIECELLPILNDYESIAELAVKNVEHGGCECVIMNTVADAINVYDSIKKIADNDCNIILYHARMPEKTKDEKIKNILKWCGKNRCERPERAIIVGTQVLEQSIDIDVDYMITAICPVDLLLQRIGRYHRHGDAGTIREYMDVKNVVQILIPDANKDAEYGGTGYVYKPCYLDATRQVIVERPVLQIPSCTPEIINRVYESADIRTMTEDRIKNAKSDAGNINIENGFELYEKCVLGKLSDRYINVRESGEPTVQIAILDEDEMKTAKDKNNNSNKKDKNNEIDIIELFKRCVVAVPLHYLNDFDGGEYGTGIFRDVKIFSLNNIVNSEDNKKIWIDSEYGFRVLDV